jgi:hypothetical protein
MADLTNGSGVYQTYNNAGTGVAELGDNKAAKAGNGIAGRTQILTLAMDAGNVTQAALDRVVDVLTHTTGGDGAADATNPDAWTIVGIQGAVGDAAVYIAIQGTGTFTTDTSNALAISGIDLTKTHDFAGLQ